MFATIVVLAIWATRSFYILSSIIILAVRFTPSLADKFLAYGARAQSQNNASDQKPVKQVQQPLVGGKSLDDLAEITVPRSWFIHFYIVCWVFEEILSHGVKLLQSFGLEIVHGDNAHIAKLCSTFVSLQSQRRFCECYWLDRASTSRMWVGHYAMGMAFYLVTNVAIWIEHIGTGPVEPSSSAKTMRYDIYRLSVCIIVFLLASFKQNQYHRYLSKLEKYTLPEKGAFKRVVAPHYTAECAIYLSLAILGAPYSDDGTLKMINGTLLCALVFIAVNLGVTADGTKEWQLRKFSNQSVQISRKWRMLPYVY